VRQVDATGVSGSGMITVAPDLALYPNGTVVTLTAVPDGDWAFLEWSGGLSTAANPAELTMTADTTVTASFYELVDRSASVATVELADIPTPGDHWRITVGAEDYEHTVQPAESVEQVASALAAEMNAATGLTAGAEGPVIAIVDPAGSVLDLAFAAVSGAAWSIDGDTPFTRTATLVGAVAPAVPWEIIVNSTACPYTPVDGETMAEVAAGLADAVNSQFVTDFVAGADVEGDPIVVVTSASGVEFTLSVLCGGVPSAMIDDTPAFPTVAELYGPFNPGDAWRAAVDGATASYTVTDGDSGFDVAAGLFPALEAATGFTARSLEASIVVAGFSDSYGLTIEVIPSGSASIDLATPAAVILSPDGPVEEGDLWRLTLDEHEFTWTAGAGDDQAVLVATLAAQVDALAGIIAGREGSLLTVAKITGGSITAALIRTPR
jgi:hypothetical protein